MLHAARNFREMLARMKGAGTRAADAAQSPPTVRQTDKAGQYPWWDRDAPRGPTGRRANPKDLASQIDTLRKICTANEIRQMMGLPELRKEVNNDGEDHHAGG